MDNCLWNFFENANELAYVFDMDSYEILYMNRKALETYNISSMDELKGKKCYEVLHKNSSPCVICNNEKLSEGEFIEWKYFNPALNRYFLFMDTMTTENGHRCRFELAIDISEHMDSQQTLDRYEDLERRINEGIKHATCEPDPDKSIDIILDFLGKILNGERTYIFEKNPSGGDDNTYEWTAAGITSEKANLQNLPPEACKDWYCCFNENKNVVLDDIEKIRYDNPLQYNILKSQNIHSIVAAPLYDDHRVIGFYGVDNPPKQELENTPNMLQVVGYFISSMLKRRDMMNQLREISVIDQLTKLGNRHAMDDYIFHLGNHEKLGIVYCDITGLKKVNDTMGHQMGDELICRASESLRSAFGEYQLFRIGGDEMLAICENIDEETLQNRIALLRKKAVENSVVLAVGAVWKKSFQNNLQKAISEAEKLMYQDKNEYYRLTGMERRKG